jgi:GH24 family phage-related lysozyme (muramidase)
MSNQEQEDVAFAKLMASREGRRNDVYKDSLDKLTVGIGHLVRPEDNLKYKEVISDERVDALFKQDGAPALAAARSQAAAAGITDSEFVPYLASVNFQLGTHWTGTFPHTWQMIMNGEYANAASDLEGSAWNKQTPVRVKDFQDALRKLPPKAK